MFKSFFKRKMHEFLDQIAWPLVSISCLIFLSPPPFYFFDGPTRSMQSILNTPGDLECHFAFHIHLLSNRLIFGIFLFHFHTVHHIESPIIFLLSLQDLLHGKSQIMEISTACLQDEDPFKSFPTGMQDVLLNARPNTVTTGGARAAERKWSTF